MLGSICYNIIQVEGDDNAPVRPRQYQPPSHEPNPARLPPLDKQGQGNGKFDTIISIPDSGRGDMKGAPMRTGPGKKSINFSLYFYIFKGNLPISKDILIHKTSFLHC